MRWHPDRAAAGDTGHERGRELATRVRAWWETRTFTGDVALTFTGLTVVSSVMMLTDLDEPKTGAFAYVHLLARLGIITVVVGIFYLDELRDRLARRCGATGRLLLRPHQAPRAIMGAVLGAAARAPLRSAAHSFTVVVAVTCVVVLILHGVGIRNPAGGRDLYRNLVVVAALLLTATTARSWWWQRRRTYLGE